MQGQTIILRQHTRSTAKALIDKAPDGFVLNVREPKRSLDQNAKLWAMLSDVSRAKPEGRMHTPEVWKCLFMHALGFETRFLMGLDGEPFPAGFRSSHLNKSQMADLITFVLEYGDRQGIAWSEPAREDA